jgi:hypothetical protein
VQRRPGRCGARCLAQHAAQHDAARLPAAAAPAQASAALLLQRCGQPSPAHPLARPLALQGLLKAGGLQAYKPQEVAALLWGFATLGHAPLRLLYTARPDWRWRRSKLKAAEKGKQYGSLRDYQPGQLASVAWSLAVMRQVGGGLGRLLHLLLPAPPAAPSVCSGSAGGAPAAGSLPAPTPAPRPSPACPP